MAAVIPAPAWWQRGAATLQPPAARGCSPKGVGLIVARALMKLSAEIIVELEELLLSRSEELGGAFRIPLTRAPASVLPRVMNMESPVMVRRSRVVAFSARAQRGVEMSLRMTRCLGMILAPPLIVILAFPRVGPPTPLRRRRTVLLLDLGAAELGTQEMARHPAAAGLANAVNGGADEMLVNIIVLLVVMTGTAMAILNG